jgi:hypothetical protein
MRKKCVGQRGGTFQTRYKQHTQDIRKNKENTGFSRHTLNTGHQYGKIDEVMTILKTAKEASYMNSLEKYCIH